MPQGVLELLHLTVETLSAECSRCDGFCKSGQSNPCAVKHLCRLSPCPEHREGDRHQLGEKLVLFAC